MFVPLCGKTPYSLVMTTKAGEVELNQALVPPLSAWLGPPTRFDSMAPWAYFSKLSTNPVARTCHIDRRTVNRARNMVRCKAFVGPANCDWLTAGDSGHDIIKGEVLFIGILSLMI